jgi:hypothetical protein
MNEVKQFYNDLKTYSEKINPTLDEYKKAYIYYNTSPQNPEYASFFSISNGNVTTLNKELFVTTNNIQVLIDKIKKSSAILEKNIGSEKVVNSELLLRLQQVEGSGNGTAIMNMNTVELYKEQYISNWSMVIGIFILTGVLITVFRKPPTTSISNSSSV